MALARVVRFCRIIHEFRDALGIQTILNPVVEQIDCLRFNSETSIDKARVDYLEIEEAFVLDNDLIVCGTRCSCVDDLDLDDQVVLKHDLFVCAILAVQNVIITKHLGFELHTELCRR